MIVTGASRGLGAKNARLFTAEGARVEQARAAYGPTDILVHNAALPPVREPAAKVNGRVTHSRQLPAESGLPQNP